jgi:hypothetical protein
MNSPVDYFFKLGEKVTHNDPKRMLDFNYYLLWIMFAAFLTILAGNLIDFYNTLKIASLGWAVVMLAILWFQYQSLKQIYDSRKMLKDYIPDKIESAEEMMGEFKNGTN